MKKATFQRSKFLNNLLDAIPSMLFIVDDDVRIVYLNAAAKKTLNSDDSQANLKHGGSILHCINSGPAGDQCGKTANCGKCVIRDSVRQASHGRTIQRRTAKMELVDDTGGRDVHFMVTAAPFVYENAALVLLIMEDVSAQKETEEKMKQLNELLERRASTDPLTGIFNRLRFNEYLDREISEARRYQHPLALIMFDIDHFKLINDSYGHHVGDRVLKELANVVSANIRDVDIFSRWGGEEFMILSPHTDLGHGRQLAEKLRTAIENHRFEGAGSITCSFGVAQFVDGDTDSSLARRADEALYHAKNGGRNRVAAFEGGVPGPAQGTRASSLRR